MDIQKQIKSIEQIAITDEEEIEILKQLYGFIDLTTLEGTDNEQVIKTLCERALHEEPKLKLLQKVASVCVYPVFVKQAKAILKGSGVKVASVAGSFPSGQSPLKLRLEELKYALAQGADEIDMVITRGKLLEGDLNFVFKEIDAFKGLCKDMHLKVIIETGELKTEKHIRAASKLAMEAGADFIKTSTGKITPAATMPASLIMMEEIKKYYMKTGHRVGIKLAGGISEPVQAIQYYHLLLNILGEDWVTKDLFRIGASRLTGNLLSRLQNLTKH